MMILSRKERRRNRMMNSVSKEEYQIGERNSL
jgi:hypothetical protein